MTVALAYRAGGINWAAGIGTATGIVLWLWSARRSYREQARGLGPRLLVDRAGEFADEERPRLSYRRVRVANTGDRMARQVEVTLTQCRPAPAWFEAVRLQRMHGGPHPFDLPPHGEVYIDLIALPHGHPEFVVVHDSAKHGGLPNGIPVQSLELIVQATASGLRSASCAVQVTRDAGGDLAVSVKSRE